MTPRRWGEIKQTPLGRAQRYATAAARPSRSMSEERGQAEGKPAPKLMSEARGHC